MCCESCFRSEQSLTGSERWNRAYINGLSDEAFAVIEPAYRQGKTKNKNCRHLPHQRAGVSRGLDSNDRIDLPHLQNALAQMGQIEAVTDSITTERLRKLAAEHLSKHARDLGVSLSKDEKPGSAAPPVINNHAHVPPAKPLILPEGFSLDASNCLSVGLVCEIGAVDSTNLEAISASLENGDQNGIDALRPKKTDYLNLLVRALSKTTVNQHIDFSKGNVLKKSMPLLKGVTVFPDHSRNVENYLGSVTKVSWDESQQPPGIDATLQIDALANPKITRGLLNEPPALKRVSVNLKLDWVKSHPDMDHWAFIDSLGKDVDGSIVRFIATEIKYYGEISLVFFGSDPNAKSKKN